VKRKGGEEMLWFSTVKRENQKWRKRFANSAASNVRKRAPCLKKLPQRSRKGAQQPRSKFYTTRKNLRISCIIVGALGFECY